MDYLSTRGAAPSIQFEEAVLSGLAPDGGLYMPKYWPSFDENDFNSMDGMTFAETAAFILSHFASAGAARSTIEKELQPLTKSAYATFDANDVTPLKNLGDDLYLLELFHGPTLAFKDVAMQLLAKLYSWARERLPSEKGRRKTIIGATSGDTGGAAIAAFAGVADVDVFMLHPKGRISDVQRRIMTVNPARNITNIAVEGSFDDCQQIVKELFVDEKLNAACNLSGVNSINWVRLAIQTVYYFTTAKALGETSYIVPTGNFGDVFAGYAAKRIGAPIGKLAVAVNKNDIMHRAVTRGEYRVATVSPTSAPSMDIQVASNFERLLFEAGGRDVNQLKSMMVQLNETRDLQIPKKIHEEIKKDFVSAAANEDEVFQKISELNSSRGELIDPHTAIGLVAADKLRDSGQLSGPIVALATAHPAKFPDAVEEASGVHPKLPLRYKDLFEKPENYLTAPANIDDVQRIILERAG